MGKETLHELIDKVSDDEINIVYFVLSRVIRGGYEVVAPLPDEIDAINEYEADKKRGDRLYSHDEVFGKEAAKSAVC